MCSPFSSYVPIEATHLPYPGQCEDRPDDGQLPQEGDNDGKEVAAGEKSADWKSTRVSCGLWQRQVMCATLSHWQVAAPHTHPNKFKKPNASMSIPQNGYRRKTSTIPPMKHAVPRSLFLRAKKATVCVCSHASWDVSHGCFAIPSK